MFIHPTKDPGIFQSFRLTNGITVYHRQAELPFGLPKLACSALILAGGRDDIPGKEGAAHFFEHMPFRGTKNFLSLAALTGPIENNGGYINAFTTDEATGYEVIVPSPMAEEAVSRVADMLQHPLMRPEDIEIERNVILEELRNKLGNVNFYARQQLFKTLLDGHPLMSAVIGTEEALLSITKDDLLDFHNRYYNATNIVLFAVGSYDESQLKKLMENYFGSIPTGEATKRDLKLPAAKLTEHIKVYTPTKYNRSVYLLGRVIPSTTYRESMLLGIYCGMLTHGMTSPLYTEIREKRGLAYNLSLFHEKYQDLSLLAFFVTTQYKNMDTIHTIAWQHFRDILTNQSRFEEVKHMRKQGALYREYGTGSLIDTAINGYLDFEQVIPLEERMQILDSVSLEEVASYVAPLLDEDMFLNIRVDCDKQRDLRE